MMNIVSPENKILIPYPSRTVIPDDPRLKSDFKSDMNIWSYNFFPVQYPAEVSQV